jgi:AmmeMemoRadiSam system protein A
MTQAAATQDKRFSPITPDEISQIRLEISILSTLEPVTEIHSLKVGVHGLHVSCGEKRGVLLPQVATEYGWDMETFLGQVCLKAKLNQEAWRSPGTRTSCFTTVVIEEEP